MLAFLSTLSLRRATGRELLLRYQDKISIHALLAESDQYWATRARAAQLFLSTLSLRRATPTLQPRHAPKRFLSTLSLRRATTRETTSIKPIFGISIHALLAESDRKLPIRLPTALHFYPRSPCGERRHRTYQINAKREFLSTLSLRRATETAPYRVWENQISIHALLAESDCTMTITICTVSKFLSTLSLRRATYLSILSLNFF